MDLSLTADGGPLTVEHVRTALSRLEQHVPWDARDPRSVCVSPAHRIVAPVWPCRDRRWAERVLDARDRGEVADTDPGDPRADA